MIGFKLFGHSSMVAYTRHRHIQEEVTYEPTEHLIPHV